MYHCTWGDVEAVENMLVTPVTVVPCVTLRLLVSPFSFQAGIAVCYFLGPEYIEHPTEGGDVLKSASLRVPSEWGGAPHGGWRFYPDALCGYVGEPTGRGGRVPGNWDSQLGRDILDGMANDRMTPA